MITLKTYIVSELQVYGALLTIAIMLRTTSPGLTHLATGSLYPLNTTSRCPLPWVPSPYHFTIWFCEFDYFRFHIQVRSFCIYVCLVYFTQHNALKVHPCCHILQDSLFYGWIIFHYICIYIHTHTHTHTQTFTHKRTLRFVFLNPDYCE